MANAFNFPQRFDQLIEMNQQAFQDGYLDVAYHTLLSAFECAHEMGSTELMSQVCELAQVELSWIDENQPGYRHSTQSALERHGGKSIYERLSVQAKRSIALKKTVEQARSWMQNR